MNTPPSSPSGSRAATGQLLTVLEETFVGAGEFGAFLEPGPNGLLPLLVQLSAKDASRPVAGASIATHALHVAFSLEAFTDWVKGKRNKNYD